MTEIPRIGGQNPVDVEDISGTIQSMPRLGVGELDSEHGVVLKDWSAQDFANIYVRFRPHLMNHARRYTREVSQAEEVVQEAFLYLMTSLPELDSELGVLRYLRWKVKNLSIDAIRRKSIAASKVQAESNQSFLEEHGSESSPEPGEGIEAAEDAAVVRLALARLNANQQQALIYDVIEEQSNADAAAQMKMEAGAFRQLLYRSRKSFKRELLQILAERGLSVEDFLKGRKYLTTFSGVAMLMLGLSLLPHSMTFPDALTSSSQDSSLDSNAGQSLVPEREVEIPTTQSGFDRPDGSPAVHTSDEIWGVTIARVDATEKPSSMLDTSAAEDTADPVQTEARPLGTLVASSQMFDSAGRVAGKILAAHYEAENQSFVSLSSEGGVFQTDEGFVVFLALTPDIKAILSLAWLNETSSPQLVSVLIEQRDQSTQLVGLASGVHSQISVDAGVVSGTTVATGFAASDLTLHDVSPLLVDGHLFNLGLEMRWSFDLSNTVLISSEVRPLVRN